MYERWLGDNFAREFRPLVGGGEGLGDEAKRLLAVFFHFCTTAATVTVQLIAAIAPLGLVPSSM